MHFRLPKFYPITDTALSPDPLSVQMASMVAGGARIVQLRDKSSGSGDLLREATAAVRVARSSGSLLIVNDRVDIAIRMGADGVHLGQDDFPPAKARDMLGENAIIGFSTHSVEQAIEALKLPIDYVAAGPIFPTVTKHDPDPVIGLQTLSDIKRAIGDLPLVAIGGITFDRALSVIEAGADSVAIIGDLFTSASPLADRVADYIQLLG